MAITKFTNQERDEYDDMIPSETPEEITPSNYVPKRLPDDDVKALFDSNKDDWKTPEYKAAMQAGTTAMSALGTALTPVTYFLETPDRVIGRPLRSLLVDGPEAAYEQTKATALGDQVPPAPSWSNVAEKFGFSGDKNIETPLYKNPQEKYKISQADIAGTVAGTVADPLSYVPGKKALDVAGKAAQIIPDVAGSTMKTAVIKGGKVLADFPEAKMSRYFDRPDQIRAMKNVKPESFEQEIQGYVGNIQGKTKEAAQTFQMEVPELLSKSKQVRGELAQKSLELLDVVPGNANKSQILNSFDAQISALEKEATPKIKQLEPTMTQRLYDEPGNVEEIPQSVVVGQTNKAAYRKLQSLRNDVSKLQEPISWASLKGVLRDISPEIQWQRNYAEINPVFDRAAKVVYGDINKSIYDAASLNPVSAPYIQTQQRIKRISTAAEQADKFYGTEDKIKRNIDAIKRSVPSGLDQSAIVDKDYKIGKIAAGRLQNLAKEMNESADYLQKLRSWASKEKNVSDITERNVEGYVKRQTGDVRRDYESKKLDYAQNFGKELNGQEILEPISERLKDFGVSEEFGKKGVLTGFRGAAFPAVGGAIGAAIAPGSETIGAAIGGLSSIGLGYFGKRVMKVFADTAMGVEGGLRYLGGENALKAISRAAESNTPWSKVLNTALAAGPKVLVTTHQALLNSDPRYKAYINEGN